MVALFFDGLNRGLYDKLKKAVHNGHVLNGNPMPETYERVLWQAEEFRAGRLSVGRKEEPGVGMAQLRRKGDKQDNSGGEDKQEGAGEDTPGVVSVQTNADGTKTNKTGR